MCMLCQATGRTKELPVVSGFSCSQASAATTNIVSASTPVFSNDQIAYQLTNTFWGGSDRSFNVGVGGNISVNITALTAAGQTLARQALELWAGATGLVFSFTSGGAHITFDDTDVWSAWNWSSTGGGTIYSSNTNVGTSWIGYYGTGINTYSLQTYVHEIGHALGLGHAGNYNGSADYGVNNHYANDSWQASVMSYFSQYENTYINASYTYAITPMVADIIAIRNLYGTTASTRTGNTIYGDNANSGDIMQTISSMNSYISYTIVDDGGIDTLDFSSYGGNQKIDLREEAISSVRGYSGNLIIARGTVIENAVGGSGNDVLVGNTNNNELFGGNGRDTLRGYSNTDRLYGGNSDDVLRGDSGNDILSGDAGADNLDGGSGNDWAYYNNSTSAVFVNLSDGAAETGGHADGDLLTNIERLLGSNFNDRLIGDNAVNQLRGYGGSDRIYGGNGDDILRGEGGNDILRGDAGADTLDGGSGDDWVYYFNSNAAIYVNLSDGTTETGGHAEGDVLANIERLLGSHYNDRLIGDSSVNQLRGYDGNDRLYGGDGDDTLQGEDGNDILRGDAGADVLDGGSGDDWAYYFNSNAATFVNLSDGAAETGGHAEGDVLTNIERLLGSNYNDRLIGDSSVNQLRGYGGNDRLYGGNGDDFLQGEDNNDILRGDAGADNLDGGSGDDWAYYFNSNAAVFVSLSDGAMETGGHAEGDVLTNIEHLLGSNYNDRLIGDISVNQIRGYDGNDRLYGGDGDDILQGEDGNDILRGDAGADTLNGGSGDDWAYYFNSNAGVFVDLSDGVAETGGHAQDDILTSIERLLGSNFNDKLVGNNFDNHLRGYNGDDLLEGNAGDDYLRGGTGEDILTGGSGSDIFAFLETTEADTITDFETGIDTIYIGLGVQNFEELTVTPEGFHTKISFLSNEIILENFNYLSLQESDFSFF